MAISFKKIVWLGIRTAKFSESCNFYEQLLGLKPLHSESGFRAYDLPDGDRIELFSDDYPTHQHFRAGQVVGFLVDDIKATRAEMETMGIEFLSAVDGTPGKTQWSHFRGPDGNVYEITERKE